MSQPRVIRVTFTGRVVLDITVGPDHPFASLTDQAIADRTSEALRPWWEEELPTHDVEAEGLRVIENIANLDVTTKETA